MKVYMSLGELKGFLEIVDDGDVDVRFRDRDGRASMGSVTGVSVSYVDGTCCAVIEAEVDE